LQLRRDVAGPHSDLAFQMWRDRSRLLASTPGAPAAPLRPDFGEGFATVVIGGEDWRVYSVSDRTGKFHVQVGNPRAMINADFQKHSLKAVSMATVPLGLAGLLMWWAVRRALKPLATIEAAARGRSKFDLTPLPSTDLPLELRPLVGSFNDLLMQLDQAIQAERRFIGDAAHELRTPLSALQAHVEVALRAKSDDERVHALTKLLAAVERSSRLSEQLLDLARLEAGNHAPVRTEYDLSEIARHVVSEFELIALRNQRSLEVALEPCRIECDVNEMGILVRNLIDNALRYTFAGGKVRIRCGYADGGAVSGAFLEIADDGPGVPAAEQSVIFERFHRASASSAVRGSGIGLSLVARIASMHRARIETGEGIGNPGLTVRVLFPAVAAKF
jgi:signal transduction histidine kinase